MVVRCCYIKKIMMTSYTGLRNDIILQLQLQESVGRQYTHSSVKKLSISFPKYDCTTYSQFAY